MNDTVLLRGVVGSQAYGLATPDSDVDRLGLYAAPTEAFHGLHLPVDKAGTKVQTNPDQQLHEVRKYARLALVCNPTVSELMWLDDYEVMHPLGAELVGIRDAFMTTRARYAYLNYAEQQFERLSNKGKFPDVPRDRMAKHARHMMRLVEQFTYLWTTGELRLKVKSPERVFEFGERVAGGDFEVGKAMLAHGWDVVENRPTALPEKADEATVDDWMRRVRRAMWTD